MFAPILMCKLIFRKFLVLSSSLSFLQGKTPLNFLLECCRISLLTALALAAMIRQNTALTADSVSLPQTIINQWKCCSSFERLHGLHCLQIPPVPPPSLIQKCISEASPSCMNIILRNRLQDHLTALPKLIPVNPSALALTRHPSSSMYLNDPAIILRFEYISFVISSGLIHLRCAQTIIHLSCMLAQM
ncbi:hypothetical protein ARMGADRAFT_682542 [Armillaria gallica]|uniref:Uncharacterized protein n=1 Tax=Armillaria gallica TaxID=47427 RepID=A0A2H3CUX5_ARMGA|nr:hypothetical protein ARMGADRAFT_682542 [Armillaria gallica]